MKIWKLVSGIISIVFASFMLLQSCTLGCAASLANNNSTLESSGVGIIVALMMLTAGIVSIASRTSTKSYGNTAIIVLFVLAGLFAFEGATESIYKDLYVWGTWCFACAIVAVIGGILNNNNKKNYEQKNSQKSSMNEQFLWFDISDDSMSPEIVNGSKILVRRTGTAESGQIAVVLVDGKEQLTRRIIYGDDWVELQALNPSFSPRRYEGTDTQRLQLIGVVQEVNKIFT